MILTFLLFIYLFACMFDYFMIIMKEDLKNNNKKKEEDKSANIFCYYFITHASALWHEKQLKFIII